MLVRTRLAHGFEVKIYSPFVHPKRVLGKGVYIGHGTELEEQAQMGRYSYVMNNSEILNAKIGAFCSIGDNVTISASDHPYSSTSTSPDLYKHVLHKKFRRSTKEAVLIGNDVWIGNNVVVLSGVNIGDGAVIGAGAVVTKDVPPYAIAVGAPARVIKYRFSDNVIEQFLSDKWWEWSEEDMLEKRDYFFRVE
jgi:acetyltransferase-like isoleucine patch superfamily enzyme